MTLLRFYTCETSREVKHRYYYTPPPPPRLLFQTLASTEGGPPARQGHDNKQLVYILLFWTNMNTAAVMSPRSQYKYANTEREEQGLCPFAIFFFLSFF